MYELKPCPFCGENVTVWESKYGSTFGVVKVIECEKCNVRFVFKWDNALDAVGLKDLWNRRYDKQ